MAPTVVFINTRFTVLETNPCFYAARQSGLDVVLLTDEPADEFTSLAAEIVTVDTFDIEAAIAAALDVASRRDVRGVVAWTDRDVEVTAKVAQALKVPGNPPVAAATVRNKGRLRRALSERYPGLTPAFYVIRNEEDLEPALSTVPLPAILKPTGASGSKGIYIVHDDATLRTAFDELMNFARPEVDPIFRYYPGELVLEEFLTGTEHSVEGIVQNSVVRSATITDKWVRAPFFMEYLQIQPTRLDPDICGLLGEAATRTVTTAGLTDGAFHLELKVTGDGRPVVVEMNGRTGGGYITSHLVELSTGYDFLRQVLRAACADGEVDAIPAAFCAAGSLQVITDLGGTFCGFSNLGEVLSIPGVLHFAYELAPGSEVRQPPATFRTPILASIIARAATPG
jgi:biotin carboxylase